MKTNLVVKIPVLLCGAIISTASLRAQDAPPPPPPNDNGDQCEMKPGGPGDRPGNPMEMLSKNLNLTEEQKAKLKPILDEELPKLKAIHEEAREKMKAAMNGVHERIKPLLTPEQQQKLEELKKRIQERGPRGGGPDSKRGGGPDGGPGRFGGHGEWGERLAKELNLTPDQQNQIKPILEDARSQMMGLRDGVASSGEEKMVKCKAIKDATEQKIKAILTPEQQVKMDQLKKEHGPGFGKPGGHQPE